MGTLLFISCCILNFKISGPWLAFCHGPSHRVTTTSSPNGNGGFGTGDFSIPGGNGNFIPHNSGDLNAPQQALYNAPQQAPYNAQQASYNAQQASYNAQQVSDLHGQRPSYETLSTQSDFNARFQHHFHHQRPH
ncbi:transcription factor GATA-6-like [Engraulis encrasicolus]|uniref:transcription factor GATA-6-like n=1 Tax=Engraulis encrasicolus TaxID=184585 RepID=UPI002FD59701